MKSGVIHRLEDSTGVTERMGERGNRRDGMQAARAPSGMANNGWMAHSGPKGRESHPHHGERRGRIRIPINIPTEMNGVFVYHTRSSRGISGRSGFLSIVPNRDGIKKKMANPHMAATRINGAWGARWGRNR